jgi:hypothetical protein
VTAAALAKAAAAAEEDAEAAENAAAKAQAEVEAAVRKARLLAERALAGVVDDLVNAVCTCWVQVQEGQAQEQRQPDVQQGVAHAPSDDALRVEWFRLRVNSAAEDEADAEEHKVCIYVYRSTRYAECALYRAH